MLIGILSDTHNDLESIDGSINIFKNKKVNLIIHCGDWIKPHAFEYFAKLILKEKFFAKGVFGNNDIESNEILKINNRLGNPVEFPKTNNFLEISLENINFAVYHGHNKLLLNNLINSQKYNYILTGHTHRIKKELIGNTVVLNPGSASYSMPRSKNNIKSVMIVNSYNNNLEIDYL